MFGLFGKKKETVPKGTWIRVTGMDRILYTGTLEEIPLKEQVILEKSDEFFNDPNPCFIHRGAVRVRLTAELEEAMQCGNWTLWNQYTDIGTVIGAECCILQQ